MPADAAIVVRRATAVDVPALGRLGAMLMRVDHDFDRQRFVAPGESAETGDAQFLESRLASEGEVVLVAARAAEVVGYVYAGVEPRSHAGRSSAIKYCTM